jgi:hypothetical protein
MSSETEHLKLALHNIEVLAYLRDRPDFCDWTATVAFYTAVHVVEAVFFHDRQRIGFSHIQNHEERERILKSIKSYQNLYKHYRPLASASVVARYLRSENQKGLCEYMNHSQVEDTLIKHHLGQLIKTAGRFLSPDCTGQLAGAFTRSFR